MESHFVVVYNHDTGKFSVADDTCMARFDNAPIWDDKNDEWFACDALVIGLESYNADLRAVLKLENMLENYNRGEG
ncbi:MAG: hypothetical protein WA061_01785 [Microgenomates group bacterium]